MWASDSHTINQRVAVKHTIPEQAPRNALSSTLRKLIDETRGTGKPLGDEARYALEHFFNRDLSSVRVHDDVSADRLARAVGALAVTAGTDIYLRAGAYRPDRPAVLGLLAHEVTHIAQRDTEGPGGGGDVMVGSAHDACEQVAADNARQVQARCAALREAGRRERGTSRPDLGAGTGEQLILRRAVGLEIEVPIPIDKLTPAQLTQIQGFIAANQFGPAIGAAQVNGRVPYGIIAVAAPATSAPGNGYRIDADHDNRVRSPMGPAAPPREGGDDSIIEIVTDPPSATAAALTAVMNDVRAFVAQVNALTNQLTTRWPNAFPVVTIGGVTFNVSVGPMDLTVQGFPLAAHMPQHNLEGSVQVNVDIDLREYHSLLHWYADSAHAQPARAALAEQAMYTRIRQDIRDAVNAGRTVTDTVLAAETPANRALAGNYRGLRGFLTHMALYLKRGAIAGGLGGSLKNLVPILVKSPNTVLATYGMTAQEQVYYNANRAALLNQLLPLVGRAALVPVGALAGVDVFTSHPGQLNLDQLSNLANAAVPLAGTPIMNPPNLGPWRTGNAAVQGIAAVPGVANTRGGLVAEFRNFPGFYDGVASWEAVGQDFLREANARNARNGIVP